MSEQDRIDAERYRKLRELHWTDGRLSVTDVASLPLGVQTYSRESLDHAIDSIPDDESE